MKSPIKIAGGVLAGLLLLCLFPMPYGYYTLVRFVSMVVFAVMAFVYFSEENKTLGVVFSALALLFQPLVKISLGKGVWNVVDVLVAVLLLVIIFKKE